MSTIIKIVPTACLSYTSVKDTVFCLIKKFTPKRFVSHFISCNYFADGSTNNPGKHYLYTHKSCILSEK